MFFVFRENSPRVSFFFFFLNERAPPKFSTFPLPDALPILRGPFQSSMGTRGPPSDFMPYPCPSSKRYRTRAPPRLITLVIIPPRTRSGPKRPHATKTH